MILSWKTLQILNIVMFKLNNYKIDKTYKLCYEYYEILNY